MQQASERDIRILEELRNEGLIDHLPDRISQLQRAVHIMCSDPFRCPEAHSNIRRLIPKTEGLPEPCIFPLYYPGGALLLAPDSPALNEGSTLDMDWMEAIRMAYEMFGITAVLAESHVACAIAYKKNLDAFRVCELSLAAKQRVEKEIPGVEFFPLIHTHGFREQRMLTYYIPQDRWRTKVSVELAACQSTSS